ncbi:YitT family protein [Paracoccaceae bacterium]|nr:YitT family protein [Paracoccaceae bacterium]
MFDFIKIGEVPKTSWSSEETFNLKPKVKTLMALVAGLILFGLGEALLVSSQMGVSPWTALAQGLANFSELGLGLTTFLISIFVLFLWIPLKQKPGIGTVLNAIIISIVLHFAIPSLPVFEENLLRLIQAILGVFITGIGGGIYLIANLGPGARDGLMTGLQRVTKFPIAWIRSTIELTVLTTGWWLGGVVGLGTVIFALGIGPCLAISLKIFSSSNSQSGH